MLADACKSVAVTRKNESPVAPRIAPLPLVVAFEIVTSVRVTVPFESITEEPPAIKSVKLEDVPVTSPPVFDAIAPYRVLLVHPVTVKRWNVTGPLEVAATHPPSPATVFVVVTTFINTPVVARTVDTRVLDAVA